MAKGLLRSALAAQLLRRKAGHPGLENPQVGVRPVSLVPDADEGAKWLSRSKLSRCAGESVLPCVEIKPVRLSSSGGGRND